jgi:hypothetical protein
VRQTGDEVPPADGVLLHALGDADDIPAAVHTHADRDRHARVLHRATPGTLMPHPIHERIRVRLGWRPGTPIVDMRVHVPELVRQGLRDGIREPRDARDMSSTRRVETPAGYIAIGASSTDSSRRRYRLRWTGFCSLCFIG